MKVLQDVYFDLSVKVAFGSKEGVPKRIKKVHVLLFHVGKRKENKIFGMGMKNNSELGIQQDVKINYRVLYFFQRIKIKESEEQIVLLLL